MKRLLLVAMALLLAGCSGRMGGVLPRGEENRQQQRLSEANVLLRQGDVRAALAVYEEVAAGPSRDGVTDEALFRMGVLNLKSGIRKEGEDSAQQALGRVVKEFPAGTWSGLAWPLLELLTADEELQRQNQSLKTRSQTLTRELRELQGLKSLNQALIRENKELHQSIERLKNLDLELERKVR